MERSAAAGLFAGIRLQLRSGAAGSLSVLLAGFASITWAADVKLSPLADVPDWSRLDAFAGHVSREAVQQALRGIYSVDGTLGGVLEVGPDALRVRVGGGEWRQIPFSKEPPQSRGGREVLSQAGRFWRKASEMGPAPGGKPLAGLRVALDPGHLGGEWAKMEERYFRLERGRAVTEGDLTLRVAKRLKPLLEQAGAEVTLLRKSDRPATRERPESLRSAALADLKGVTVPEKIRLHSELLFYRVSEIRARARLVNEEVRPDLVVCLHLNAEDWGEPEKPRLAVRNHLHALVNGCYSERELEFEDVRAEMVERLLSGVEEEGIAVSEAVVERVAEGTGLPPFTYFSSNARRVGSGAYLYARNLLATRLYRAPVVFLEPYVMNSEPVWKRVQLGEYSGLREVDGQRRPCLSAEYAQAVADGLCSYYTTARR
jgi:hypothetical protein